MSTAERGAHEQHDFAAAKTLQSPERRPQAAMSSGSCAGRFLTFSARQAINRNLKYLRVKAILRSSKKSVMLQCKHDNKVGLHAARSGV